MTSADMNPEVSDEDFRDILAQTRHFVRTVVVPRESEIMTDDRVPDDIRDQAKKMGLFGYAIPQEWGGLGLNLAQDVELAMEFGYTSLALRSMFGTNNGIAGQVLVGFGTDEQKTRWLEGIASGEVVASFALTEPGAGSNPSGLRTKAVRDGDDWVITGQKQYITNAPTANLFVVFARTRPADDKGAGIAVFLVPADTAGVEVGAKDAKMGQEGAWTSDVNFNDVRVPDSALVGGSRGHRLPRGDDLAGARPHAHRRAGRRRRAARPRRVGGLRRDRHPGRHADRRVPAGAGDDRRPADRRDGRPGPGPRRRADVGRPRRTAGSRRRRRSCSAPRWPARSPISRSRSTAAPATCATFRSNASTATSGCCGSTRAPARSSASSSAADS